MQGKVSPQHHYKNPKRTVSLAIQEKLGIWKLSYKLKNLDQQLTISESEVRPTIWQNACRGAVRKKVNWLPLCVVSTADGFLNAGLKGERSKAAGSPLSAPCRTWKSSTTQINNLTDKPELNRARWNAENPRYDTPCRWMIRSIDNICLINPFAVMPARQIDIGRKESDLNACHKMRLCMPSSYLHSRLKIKE